jgi:hypothetical protein
MMAHSPAIMLALDGAGWLPHDGSMICVPFKRVFRLALQGLGLVCLGLASLVLAVPAEAIVGGHLVRSSDQARRWTVKIDSSKGELCSGVAIQPRVVLTAAHCVIGGGRFTVTALDEHMRPVGLRALRVVAHASFIPGRTPSTQPGIDLAMLLLASDLPGSVQPVSLGGALGLGDRLSISGFGLGQEDRRQSARTLRQGDLMAAGSYTSSNSVVVAVDSNGLGQDAGAGACKGDSGGPIMRGGRGASELVGIVSWSSGPANQRVRRVCGGFTAITPVADHRAWIMATAGSLTSDVPADARAAPERRALRGRAGRITAPPAPDTGIDLMFRPSNN